MPAKCPKCERNLTHFDVETMDIYASYKPAYKGVVYVCPHADCRTILSAVMDQLAVKADIVNEVVKTLRDDSRNRR